MKNPITKLAAVAAIIIAVFSVLTFTGGPDMASVAWGQVVEAFNRANNVHIVKMGILDQGVAVNDHEAWIKNQTLFRVEADNYCIVDNGRRVLTLYKNLKVAHLRDSFTPYWDYTPLILKIFRDGLSEKGITVTRSAVERSEAANIYEIDFRGLWRGKAWVDRATNLPLRITGSQTAYTGRTQTFEMRFDYETIPDETFSTSIPTGYRELPNLMYEDMPEGRGDETVVLSGVVVDSQGNPVPDARIFASYAAPGQTDSEGAFALVAPPTDSSGSLSPVDFPMFVWAYTDDDPHSLAWTLIRCPISDEADDHVQNIEDTHQGVELVIGNEDELIRDIPDQGVFSDDEHGSHVSDITLAMAEASVITGQVTNTDGIPLANAIIQVEMIQLQIGSNTLTVEDLDDEWKAGFYTVTDRSGRYTLGHLPKPWSLARLKIQAQGRISKQQLIRNSGQDNVYDFQLSEEQSLLFDDNDMPRARETVLSGVVVDSQGNPVPDARIFASYAAPGQTDSEGAFALVAPPTDSSGSLSPVDFPMFVWAYTDDDPYNLAWTLIRRPVSDETDEQEENTESTHQGVELVIENEDEINQNIPGSQGVFLNIEDSQVYEIVLVKAPANVITGKITNPRGAPLANAIVQAEMIQLQIGSNTLAVEDLDDEWKAGFTTVTDSSGNYTLGHLPRFWSQASIVVRSENLELSPQSISKTGQNTLCNITIK